MSTEVAVATARTAGMRPAAAAREAAMVARVAVRVEAATAVADSGEAAREVAMAAVRAVAARAVGVREAPKAAGDRHKLRRGCECATDQHPA